MPVILPATGICQGGLSSNSIEFLGVNTSFMAVEAALVTVNTALTAVNTSLAATTAALTSTSTQTTALELELAALSATTTAILLKINSSVRGPAVGVKSTDANFNYNVNVNVLTARNALAGPTDQIPIPPPPVGL
jgi:hypothetical protein